MNLTTWKSPLLPHWARRPEKELSSVQRDMDEMMDSFFGRGRPAQPQIYSMDFYPAVDLKEKDDKYLIEAELPGLAENDVTLDFHDNILTIKGEKKAETKVQDVDYARTERFFGSFRRDIPFDKEIDANKVSAELTNGILNIQLVKKQKSSVAHKKIPIK